MSALVEAFLAADDDAPVEKDDLIYKEILREGEFKFTPTSDGVKPVPFRVVRSGPSSQSDRTISIEDVVTSFKGKAYEHVQVPLGEKQGRDHEDYARLNTGFVDDLKVVDGEDGKARILAGIRFTEPDVKEKCLRGTYANVSSGIWFDRVRPSDGVRFPAALRHVAITNTPFQDNLKPFGVAMSEADGVEAPEEAYSVAMAEDEVVWSPNESFSRLNENVNKALRDLAEQLNPGGIAEGPDAPAPTIFLPRDIWTTKVLVENMESGESFVAPFKRKRDKVEFAPQDEWTRADQQWIAASEGSPTHVQGLAFAEALKSELTPEPKNQEAPEPPEEQAVRASEAAPAAPARRADTPQLRLKEAQENRRARLRRPANENARGGARMGAMISAIDLSSLELADDQKSALQAVLDENARLREEGRKKAVEDEVTRVMDLGLSEDTGFVKTYRRLLLADDQGTAAVLMSDGGGQEEITLTGALKLLIDALPKNSDGKIVLSEQQLVTGGDIKPPAEAADEQDETTEDAIAATRKALGLTRQED